MTMMMARSWRNVLQEEIEKQYINDLKAFISAERVTGHQVFPPQEHIFEALKYTPFESVKVVIMGQDPYHGPGQAHGLSFSVQKGVRIPPSLRNIYKELEADLGTPPPSHGCLLHWASQGVLLLNATLTVRQGGPKSHYGKGWERFTDAIIEHLRDREDPLVFILWGKSASEKCARILDVKKHPHAILKSPHPSPYAAASGFFGSRPFSKTNKFLESFGKTPVDWSVPSE